ncbi:unnamed protein product [Trichobilharzia regenti]|nr:unnamed protein product [Trichobilharzia regenti]
MGANSSLQQNNQLCTTFKASCSQFPGYRVNSPSYKDAESLGNLNSPNEVSIII